MRNLTVFLMMFAVLVGTTGSSVATARAPAADRPSASEEIEPVDPVLRLVRIGGRKPGNTEARAIYAGGSLGIVVQGKNTTVAVRTRVGTGDWSTATTAQLPVTSEPAYGVALTNLTLTAPDYLGKPAWQVEVGWLDVNGEWEWTDPTSFAVLKPDVVTPASASRRWASLAGDKRARWNPCQAITYRVNVAGATGSNAMALRQVKESVAYIGHASGLTFTYLGPTTVGAGGNTTSTADLTIVIGHFTSGKVAGNAKVWWSTLDGASFYLINRAKVRLESRYDNPRYRQDYLRHELLHALGLGHSKSRADLMYPQATGDPNLGWGDRVGISTVGRQAGCA